MRSHLSATTLSSLRKAFVWLAVLLAFGAALTLLPVPWLAAGLLALIVTTLTFIKPQTALYLICFAVPFGSLLAIDVAGVSVSVTEALIALALAAWLARVIAFRQPIEWPRLALPVALFAGGGVFSLLHARSLPLAAKELAKWIEFLAIMLLVTNVVTQRQSQFVVACLLFAGGSQAALGAYQFLTRSGPEGFAFGRFLRAYGTFEQPNPFGGYLGLVAPFALALVLCSGRKGLPPWLRWLAVGSFAVSSAGIAMSGSRGAWLAACVAIGVVTLLHGRQGRYILLVLVLLAALAGLLGGLSLVPDQVLDRLTGFLPFVGTSDVSSVEVTDANYANLERLAFWQAATGMWAENLWLGVGIGNYQAAYPRYSLPKWRLHLGHAHNYYLNIAAETGLIGLSAYVILWATTIWTTAKAALQAKTAYVKALSLGALGIVIHASVHNVVDNLWVHHLYVHVAILLGLTQIQPPLTGTAATSSAA